MAEERVAQDQFIECGLIVDRLVTMMDAAKDAFSRQQIRLLADLNNQLETLKDEVESSVRKVRRMAAQTTGDEKEALMRLQSIHAHLQAVADAIAQIELPLRNQIRDGILFSDKASSQIKHLFVTQAEILHSLGHLMRKADEGTRSRCLEECKELGQQCLQFTEEHEDRMVEGVCPPQAAPLFLAIIDQMQTMIQHESGMATLLRF